MNVSQMQTPEQHTARAHVAAEVRGHLAKGVALCEQHGDYVSREVLVTQLADTEEDHTWWLEKQLRLIEMIGLENYQQSKMGEDGGGTAA